MESIPCAGPLSLAKPHAIPKSATLGTPPKFRDGFQSFLNRRLLLCPAGNTMLKDTINNPHLRTG